VTDSVIVGRNTARQPNAADISVDDEYVSNRHAKLMRQGSQLLVEDLGSMNGTWLNGRRVYGPVAVRPGDRLRVGHTEVTLPETLFS
jgi:pSer/pThr/pTyr-binding forkhead associated (FHA) protein